MHTSGAAAAGPDTPACPGAPAGPDTALYEVTFVVLDVETTGGTAGEAALTEVGAAAYRGGDCLGTFATLVDPGCPVPEFVSQLTGITDAMVAGAPSPAWAVDRLLDFVGGAALVGHNVAFDLSFLDAEAGRGARARGDNPVVDTLALARRLVRDVAADCSLHTLAAALRLEHRPAHRALADALATADLLHRLIEAATGYGVLCLGDLLALPERLAPMPTARPPLLATA